MLSGPPSPLPPNFPVRRVLQFLQPHLNTGAWFRGATRSLWLCAHCTERRAKVLIAGDLGLLIGRCARVIVLEGAEAVLLESELLIQWRALQVVTATPYLPCPLRLKQLFTHVEVDGGGFHVPTGRCPPEAVLAECLIHGIPVAGTRIIYPPPKQIRPVDATLSAPLR